MFRALVAIALVLGFGGDGWAQACSCARVESPCSAYWRVDAVFVGRAEAIGGASGARVVKFTVLEAFFGVGSKTVEVDVGSPRTRCGGSYRAGREYLVYAVRDGRGALALATCERVRPVDDAAADLSYARAVKDGSAPAGKISGQVLVARRDLAGRRLGAPAPLKDLPVRVEKYAAAGPSPQETVLTNEAGDFSVGARGVGRYVITLDLQSRYFVANDVTQIELRDPRACAALDLVIHENGRVAGRVVDAGGRPVPGLTIDLASPTLAQRIRTITDRSGQYEFERVPSGRFVVGIDLAGLSGGVAAALRHPRIFLPGVDKASAASRVVVARGDRVTLTDFKLPASAALVSISGTVIDADGTPAEGARVYLKRAAEDGRILAEPATADFLGRFVVSVVAGGDYEIFAERSRGTRVDSSPATRLRATSAPSAPLKLVLQRRY
ncbi:MAG TPA: carboxypeptidase-like regulatory domain-containing protein [Vicinamibacterales bacterium]|nr:carboxypeptidase-like regulatory domain-containing protein [Vicinamibacterales bacterium]